MFTDSFRAAGHPWRLFCGRETIESQLANAVDRVRAKRALVICSPSVNRRTNTVQRIAAALGDRFAGVFDEIENDSTYRSVCAATDVARGVGADLLIAVGGGSVLVAVRAVAIFLAETGDPFEIMTQYPENGRPFSPRLMAPKLPIINIPTTPTSAMNRAGTGLKNTDLDHRMEYFDPKTRPNAIFLDDEALASVPASVLRSTATTLFCALMAAEASPPSNPLAQGDQAQAFKLGFAGYSRLHENADDPMLRRDLALSAFLQNRAEDDGRALLHGGPFSGDYAVSTAIHIRYPRIGQGESTSVLRASAIRLAQPDELGGAKASARAVQIWREGMTDDEARHAVADRLEAMFLANDMPIQLRTLDIPQADFDAIAAETVKNFNARANRGTTQERLERTMRLLEAAW